MNEYVQECSTSKWLKQIQEWKEEHPLTMKDRGMMGPLDIIGEINRQFDKAILVTDVGQHQMLVSQYADITENRQLIMSGGLGTMGYGLPGAIGAKIGNPDTPVISVSGDGGMQMNIQELPPLFWKNFQSSAAFLITNIWEWSASGRNFSMENAML